MKSPKRITKAAVVILIVGVGLFYNLSTKISTNCFKITSSINAEEASLKSDSIKSSDNKLFIYTKNIISEVIHHLISNL
jgi:hypothetical protein